jgi:uncharacterized membrane protein YbhN (UPF0104 family)
MLYRDLRHYTLADFQEALLRISPARMLICVALTVVNYIVLMGYDLLAVRSIRHPLPLKRVAFASFVGFAMSYNFGSLLGGGSVRYRFYSLWGLRPAEIVQLVMILAITFWIGVFALAGVVFLWEPMEIVQELKLPVRNTTPLAWSLIAVAAGYLALSAIWRKPIHLGGKEYRLPGPGMSAAQLAVAALDLIIAAACFHVLFPGDLSISYASILGTYLMAVVAGVLVHAPGGAGVFELVMISMAPPELKPVYTAVCVVFRALYNWLPLLIAGPMYILYEHRLRARRRQAKSTSVRDRS